GRRGARVPRADVRLVPQDGTARRLVGRLDDGAVRAVPLRAGADPRAARPRRLAGDGPRGDRQHRVEHGGARHGEHPGRDHDPQPALTAGPARPVSPARRTRPVRSSAVRAAERAAGETSEPAAGTAGARPSATRTTATRTTATRTTATRTRVAPAVAA